MPNPLTMARISHSVTLAWFGGSSEPILWKRWSLLTAVAVGGSLLYGASLAMVLPGWTITSAALWLAISAGLAWCVLIPVLSCIGHVRLAPCIDACLVTMACGEVVLGLGVLINSVLWFRGVTAGAGWLNVAIVGVSNVIMALVLVHRLRSHRVSPARVWTTWMLALNGSGAVFFFAFHQWLHHA